MPPCPGRIEEESFTPALRFRADSARSPTWPAIAVNTDIHTRLVHGSPSRHSPTTVPTIALPISPGKTWEGVAGGLVAALAMATLAHFWFFRDLPLKYALPLAAVMTVIGILGDLAESALKRGAGAKDAANILPGHGGILDRLDSLLFNAPLLYYFGAAFFQRFQ